MPEEGFEPSAQGFSVQCSTNWAIQAEFDNAVIKCNYFIIYLLNWFKWNFIRYKIGGT